MDDKQEPTPQLLDADGKPIEPEWLDAPPIMSISFRCPQCGAWGVLRDPKAVKHIVSSPRATIEMNEPCPCGARARIKRPEPPRITQRPLNRMERRVLAAQVRK
jgi:hypothetical protein